jgi:hypothetical protein
METLLDAMCGSSSSSSTDSSNPGQTAASGASAVAGGGGGSRAVVQLSALLYGTFLKQAVLATGRSNRAASGKRYCGSPAVQNNKQSDNAEEHVTRQ